MVNLSRLKCRRRESGALITEIVIALGIVVFALMPMAFVYADNQKQVRTLYRKAVALEIIDGEMEILMSGEWRSFHEGSQAYPLAAESAKSLPRGKTLLIVSGRHLRLQWTPEDVHQGKAIIREATVK